MILAQENPNKDDLAKFKKRRANLMRTIPALVELSLHRLKTCMTILRDSTTET